MGREGEPTRTSLTLDSTSSDKFPPINHAQHDAISRVIAALPPRESSWEVLHKTANKIGADGDEPYALLLKLALVTGKDWKEKWEKAKHSLEERGMVFDGPGRDHTREEGTPKSKTSEASSERRPRVKSAGGFDVLRAKVDQVTTAAGTARERTTHATPSAVASSSRPTPPILAEPKPTSRPPSSSARARDFLVRPTHGHSSSSEDFVGVPTPRHPRERTEPIPHSTSKAPSILPTTHRSSAKHTSLPPPTSSSTPRPRSRPAEPPLVSTFNADYPSESIYRPSKLDALADDFRRTSLLSRSWESWRVRSANLTVRMAQVTLLRQAAVRSWVVGQWGTRLREVKELKERGEMVIRGIELELLRSVMIDWVERVGKSRRDAWEQNLRSLWNIMRTKYKERLKREAFEKWRIATRHSLADKFRRRALTEGPLKIWKSRLAKVDDLSTRAQEVVDRGDVATMITVLHIWQRNAALQLELGEFVRVQEGRVREMCWDLWRDRLRTSRHRQGLEQVADGVSDTSRLKRAFGKWRGRMARLQHLSTQATRFAQNRDHQLIDRTFDYWIVEYSGSLLLNTRAVRLARTSLRNWADKYFHIAADLEGRAIAFAARKDDQLLHSCLDQWVEASDRRKVLAVAADRAHDRAVTTRAVQKWRRALQTRAVDHAKADVARTFFLHRTMWNKWQEALAQRKVQAWMAERAKRQRAAAFTQWLKMYRKARAEQVLVANFRTEVDLRIERDYLKVWVERVIEIRARELEADAEYDNKLLEGAYDRWVAACRRRGRGYQLSNSFRDVKTDGLKRRLFRHWIQKARQSSQIKRRLEEALEQHRIETLEGTFGKWRERFLRPIEMDVAKAHQDQTLAHAFRTWQSRTQSLPAIRYDRQHTGRRFFDAWRAQVTDPVLVRDAICFDRETTLGHCINLWRVRLQARTALRSASRFRSFVASSSSPATPTQPPPPPRQMTPSRGPVLSLTSPEWRSSAPLSSSLPVRGPRSPLRTSPPSATPSNARIIPLHRTPLSSRMPLSIDRSPLPAAGSQDSPGSIGNSSDRSRDDSLRARLRAAAAAGRRS